MMKEADDEAGDAGAVMASIRAAKKEGRPKKIGVVDVKSKDVKHRSKAGSAKKRRVTSKVGGAFDRDFGQKGNAREGVRAKKGDKVSLHPKKGAKRKSK